MPGAFRDNLDTTRSIELDRAQGCLLGQLAGDSLGSLVEFQSPRQIQARYPEGPRLLEDGGVWNTLAGQPTDDSELALALVRSIVKSSGYFREAAAQAYADWFDSDPFDIGNATRAALGGASAARRAGRPAALGAETHALADTQANGALMRVGPLGIYGAGIAEDDLLALARSDAQLTHPHPVCQDASAVFVAAIAFAIRSRETPEAVYEHALHLAKNKKMESAVIERIERARTEAAADFLHQQGWVLLALQNAFYRLRNAPSLEEGVISTVRCGGDTDTNGAIAGALLGAAFGRGAIPPQWRDGVLACRPEQGRPHVYRPRPTTYWPIDALEVAELLLMAG